MLKKTQLAVGVLLLTMFATLASLNPTRADATMDDWDWVRAVLVTEFHVEQDDAMILTDAIVRASFTEKVPVEYVLAIMSFESEFDPAAVSVCHAIGFMQVRPDVWDGEQPYNIHDKYENIFAGAWVLGYYRDKFGGLEHAVPAYNVGETRYRKGEAKGAQRRYIHKFNRAMQRISKYPRTIDSV